MLGSATLEVFWGFMCLFLRRGHHVIQASLEPPHTEVAGMCYHAGLVVLLPLQLRAGSDGKMTAALKDRLACVADTRIIIYIFTGTDTCSKLPSDPFQLDGVGFFRPAHPYRDECHLQRDRG